MKLPLFLSGLFAGLGFTATQAASPFGALVAMAPAGGPADVSPLLTEGLNVALAGGVGLVGTAGAVITPFLARYLGHRAAVLMMARVEQLLDKGLSYGVEMAKHQIVEHGPFKVDPGSFIAKAALEYANANGGRFAAKLVALEQKLIARLDTHLGVQALRAEVDAAAAPASAPSAPLDLTPALAKAA